MQRLKIGKTEFPISYNKELDCYVVDGTRDLMLSVLDSIVSNRWNIDSVQNKKRTTAYCLAKVLFTKLAHDDCGFTLDEISVYLGTTKRNVYSQLVRACELILYDRRFKTIYADVKKEIV